MSTRAAVKMKDYDGEWYSYTVSCDGYPSGIIGSIPQGNPTYEAVRQALGARDYYDACSEYVYEIDVQTCMVSVYEAKYIPEQRERLSYRAARFEKGRKLFEGTFDEAKKAFC